MATRPIEKLDESMRAVAMRWQGLTQTSADDGAPFDGPDYADFSVQVEGTLGAGGALVFEGSNDGANYRTLTDPQGNALSFTSVGRIEQVQEITRFKRPRVTGGDANTNFTVTLYGRRR